MDNWGPSAQADQVIHQLPRCIKGRDIEGEGRKGSESSERKGRRRKRGKTGDLCNSFPVWCRGGMSNMLCGIYTYIYICNCMCVVCLVYYACGCM